MTARARADPDRRQELLSALPCECQGPQHSDHLCFLRCTSREPAQGWSSQDWEWHGAAGTAGSGLTHCARLLTLAGECEVASGGQAISEEEDAAADPRSSGRV